MYPPRLAMARGNPFDKALLPFTALPSAVPAMRGPRKKMHRILALPPQPLQPPARLLGGEGV